LVTVWPFAYAHVTFQLDREEEPAVTVIVALKPFGVLPPFCHWDATA
jgi:hypothetical protein